MPTPDLPKYSDAPTRRDKGVALLWWKPNKRLPIYDVVPTHFRLKAIPLSLSHFASHDACMHVMKEGKETWSPRRAEGTTWAPALQQVTGDYNGSGEEERSTRSTACSGRGRLYTVPYNCEKGIQYNTIVRREYKDNASGKQLPVRECWTGSGRAGVAKISPLKLLTFPEHPEKCDRKSILFLIDVWCSVLVLYVLFKKCFHLSLETN